jgi:hypothetical protein
VCCLCRVELFLSLTHRRFGSGNVDIRRALPFLGNTQLQALTLLTTVVLVGTHGLTTYSVKERVLISDSCVCLKFISTLPPVA